MERIGRRAMGSSVVPAWGRLVKNIASGTSEVAVRVQEDVD